MAVSGQILMAANKSQVRRVSPLVKLGEMQAQRLHLRLSFPQLLPQGCLRRRLRTVSALVTGSGVLHMRYLASGADPDGGEDSHDLPATFPAFHRVVEVVTFVIRVLRLPRRVPAGESQLPDNQAGLVMRVIRPRTDAPRRGRKRSIVSALIGGAGQQ
jgi:hypothetical protein